MRRIYLDNAATSWPKPEAVYHAIDHYQRHSGAPAGRGTYNEAIQVDRQVRQTRRALAQLIDAPSDRCVVFCYSGTDALTIAMRGLLRPGDHVITSVCDHNAVLRPLRYWEDQGEVHVDRVPCDPSGRIDPQRVADALRTNTRLVALTHASNVTGALQPLKPISELLKHHPAKLLVDAAQTLGHIPLRVQDLGCDLLAAPGHKGLLGPTGTGFLYLRPGVERELQPVRMGGTGTQSEWDQPPDSLPERFEAGNLNVPGIMGMAAGIAYLKQRGVDQLAQHERDLSGDLIDRLQQLPGVAVYGPTDPSERVGVVSINVEGHDAQEVATVLDQAARIQVRAGFHCAPLMHRALKTERLGGTVRLSCGPFNEAADVDAVIQTLRQLTP